MCVCVCVYSTIHTAFILLSSCLSMFHIIQTVPHCFLCSRNCKKDVGVGVRPWNQRPGLIESKHGTGAGAALGQATARRGFARCAGRVGTVGVGASDSTRADEKTRCHTWETGTRPASLTAPAQRRRRLSLLLSGAVPAHPAAVRLPTGCAVDGTVAVSRLARQSQCFHPIHPSCT